jgi:hypothetical protein
LNNFFGLVLPKKAQKTCALSTKFRIEGQSIQITF